MTRWEGSRRSVHHDLVVSVDTSVRGGLNGESKETSQSYIGKRSQAAGLGKKAVTMAETAREAG